MKNLAVCLTLALAGTSFAGSINPKVIYGDDDRRDLYDGQNDPLHVTLAQSTAMLTKRSNISINAQDPTLADIASNTLGEALNLCSTERFTEQPNPGFCSGFLVGKTTFVTAGHCIKSASDCSSTALVFDFGFDTENKQLKSVPTDNIYNCKRIISQELNSSNKNDYAVIELDREVTDREPLAFRTEGTIEDGDPLVVIGHPSGLPTKIAGGATVRSNTPDKFFTANLDTYGGNSGSAVFNSSTGVVEGILVRGETDYVMQGNCRISNHCELTGCRGEDVTKAVEFARFVPDPNTPVKPTRDLIEEDSLSLAIPDNDENGASHSLEITEEGTLADLGVTIELTHTYIGDLEISLIGPNGESAILQSRSGGGTANLSTTFGLDGQFVADLGKFKEKSTLGTWTVLVKDLASRDEGTLDRVKLTLRVYADQ
jgi:subtilisin-like proprotein convertase family protein